MLCDSRSVRDPGELMRTSPRCACAGGRPVERGPADLQGILAWSAGRAAGRVWQRGWQERLQVRSAVVRLQEIT